MIAADETFDGTWPFAARFSSAPGFRMHYIDEGAGDPVILLHGEPTWGYIYRRFVPPLAERYRVIVPDHMGFGKSEAPQDRIYTLQTHVENLTALIDELRLERITLVMQDWGGPIGTAFTLRNPDRVRALAFLNTNTGYGVLGRRDLPDLFTHSDWFRWIREALETGAYDSVMRHLGVTVLSVMHIIGFRNYAAVDETFVRAYSAPFRTPADCIGAVNFPLDLYHRRIRAYVLDGRKGLDELKTKPAILIEGMLDRAIPPDLAIADFLGLWPDGPVHRLPNAGHYCQEDEPEEILRHVRTFLDRQI